MYQMCIRDSSMYRSGSATFLDFLMGATSFAEFTQNWDILNGLNENDSQMVAETKELRESVEASKAEYAKQEKIAADKAAEAKAIKEEVEAKIAQADALMNSLDAEARVLLEEEQRAAAEAAAAQKQAEMEAEAAREAANNGNTGGGGGGGTGGGNPPSGGGGNGVDIPSQGSVVDYAMSLSLIHIYMARPVRRCAGHELPAGSIALLHRRRRPVRRGARARPRCV